MCVGLPGSNPGHASSYAATGASYGDAAGWRDPSVVQETVLVDGLKYA